ncbi:Uu.00g012750.m01.CDS01 [Anthostomella pinea]|uniref:Uu.00g012750.m01.CDS01 n=1 Tax=Anthostomella pinea TaxID=933095 RepID=A0AAI8VY01_9PEZI|nr:Uu.00g012750.m01.CDS01 [Anthostomella pinea]
MPVQPLAFSLPLCTGCLTNTQATFLIYPSLQGNVVERADPATLPQRLEGANVVYVAIPCGPNAPPGPYAHAHPQPTTPWLPNSHIPHQSHPLQRQNETYSNAHAAHECLCGPGCECLGCIDHPFNSATEAYVQSAYHLSNSEWNGGAGLTGESNGAGLQSAGHATPQEETSDDISLQLALAGLTNNSPPGQVVDPNSFFFVEYPIDLAYTDNNAGPSGRAAAADLANGRRNDCDML